MAKLKIVQEERCKLTREVWALEDAIDKLGDQIFELEKEVYEYKYEIKCIEAVISALEEEIER